MVNVPVSAAWLAFITSSTTTIIAVDAETEDWIDTVMLFASLIVQVCPVEEHELANTIDKSDGNVISIKLPDASAC